MDIITISSFLLPWLPVLLKKAGESALSSATNKMGEDAWEQAKAIWAKLHPKIEVETSAKIAAEKLAAKPDSAAWQEAFQEELEAILEKDPELKAAIAEIIENTEGGEGSTSIQQNIGTVQRGQAINNMQNSTAKNIGSVGSVGGDVNW